MNLINSEFENLLDNHYLTENISLLIYSLIRTTRPLKVIEFGAGYSTICIAKAFQDIQKEEFNPNIDPQKWAFFREKHFRNFESIYRQKIYKAYSLCFIEGSIHTGNKYNPKLITVDNSANFSSTQNSFNDIAPILQKLNLSHYVEFINFDWIEKIKSLDESDQFDFIWIDIGTGLEYKEIFNMIFPRLNPAGMLAFHNVATNTASRQFLAEMKLKCKLSDEFEMMTLWEPHKKRQNSIVLFKKNCDYPIFNHIAK